MGTICHYPGCNTRARYTGKHQNKQIKAYCAKHNTQLVQAAILIDSVSIKERPYMNPLLNTPTPPNFTNETPGEWE